jgi:prepilin-type N-terminal cleavage/methylation domain-containing protein
MDQQIDMDVVKANKKLSKPLSKGFTIVELIIVIVIIGILTTIATPLMNDWARETRVKTSADDFVAFLDQARNATYQTSSPVVVQPVQNNDWNNGFQACVGNCNNDGNTVAIARLKDTNVVTNLGNNLNFQFRPDGFTQMPGNLQNIIFVFCTMNGNQVHRRDVVLGRMGTTTVTGYSIDPNNDCVIDNGGN